MHVELFRKEVFWCLQLTLKGTAKKKKKHVYVYMNSGTEREVKQM